MTQIPKLHSSPPHLTQMPQRRSMCSNAWGKMSVLNHNSSSASSGELSPQNPWCDKEAPKGLHPIASPTYPPLSPLSRTRGRSRKQRKAQETDSGHSHDKEMDGFLHQKLSVSRGCLDQNDEHIPVPSGPSLPEPGHQQHLCT